MIFTDSQFSGNKQGSKNCLDFFNLILIFSKAAPTSIHPMTIDEDITITRGGSGMTFMLRAEHKVSKFSEILTKDPSKFPKICKISLKSDRIFGLAPKSGHNDTQHGYMMFSSKFS